MAEQTFALLKAREGMKTSINGATQIRAGVVRPEILIPIVPEVATETASEAADGNVLKVFWKSAARSVSSGNRISANWDAYHGTAGRTSELGDRGTGAGVTGRTLGWRTDATPSCQR